MDDINFEKHYAAFKWAVSKDWKDKNELYKLIQYKMFVLSNEYGLSEQEIVDELFENYWRRGLYHKFDKSKGSLNNWIAGHVNLYLNHFIRRYAIGAKNKPSQKIDPLDHRNWANLEWIDKENTRDDPDYQPEILFDQANPEEQLIAKETIQFAYSHFNKTEIAYLSGEIDLSEASGKMGLSSDAFRKRLERRKNHFRNAMAALEQSIP